MKLKTIVFALPAIAALSFLTSCSKTDSKLVPDVKSSQSSLQDKMSENGANPDEAIFARADSGNKPNHFYITSNRRGKNTILVFTQKQNGQLLLEDEVKSGGSGFGQSLGSQGAISVSKAYNLLFAVNPASNSVSSFRINPATGGLELLFTANTNGQVPTSVTVHGNKLYVLNNLTSTICGFTFTGNGFLSKITGSEQSLSKVNADGAQISFQPDGSALYVTEKATNIIDKFTLDNNGVIISTKLIQSHGVQPFGFNFGRNDRYLVVANAANGFSGAGSASSYKFSNTQGLEFVNSASNFESGPCWVATTTNGVFAFVSNTPGNNLSSFYIDQDGALTLIKPVAAQDGQKPIDIAVSSDNKFVYVIYSGSHSVVAYRRMNAGIIKLVDKVTALPAFAAGLAVY